MKKENRKQAEQHLEAFISIGFGKAHDFRFPNRRVDGLVRRDEKSLVGWHMECLDKLGVTWSTQNNALMFINEHDTERTWNCFYRNSFQSLARRILEGSTYFELTRD